MSKLKDYNTDLRSSILICSLREEEIATQTIMYLLRVIKPKSKTLGNKSSSLSFKNKIDLLYDLGDFTSEEYTKYVKFMEIRNQFMHNPNCNSFEDLVKEVPELKNFLLKSIPSRWQQIEKIQTEKPIEIEATESFYKLGYKYLFVSTFAPLFTRRAEYKKGQVLEMERYVDSKIQSDFSNIYDKAVSSYQPIQNGIIGFGIPSVQNINPKQELISFKQHLSITILEEKIKIYDSIVETDGIEREIFKRRTDINAEIEAEIKAEKESKSTQENIKKE